MEKLTNSDHIGVFDSGIGGLTVLCELQRMLPHESFVYFGDTARLPYGEKSRETVIRYSIENSNFLIEQQIKMLIVACSTASSHALERLQQIFRIPVIGVIEPGAKKAVEISSNGRIAVLGTKGTIASQSYQKAILQKNPQAYLLPIACPLFVPLVEENYVNHPATRLIVRDYLKSVREQHVDTILLGCTHYPLLKEIIRSEVDEGVSIIDSALSCAEMVEKLLTENKIKEPRKITPKHKYYVSDDPQKFQVLGHTLLKMPHLHVELKRFGN